MARLIAILLLTLAPITAQTAPPLAAKDVHLVDIDGRTLAYTVEDNFAVTQGDIILGTAADLARYATTPSEKRTVQTRSLHAALGGTGAQLWPNATMYYTIDPSAPVQQNLLDAVAYWNKVGPFKVLPRTSEPNYVTFRNIVTDAACNSSIGMVGGQQFIGVTSACSVGAAIHEIGHAWGLLHEHTRADRGGSITVLYDNIDKRYVSNFNQSTTSSDVGYYDFDSIMHYGASGFARNYGESLETVPPGIPIGQRVALSAGDIDGVLRLYGTIPTGTTITTTPSGLPIEVDGAAGTSPRTFQWAPGSQHTVSVPVTQGSSPRYVFASWSDRGAATHTVTAAADRTVFCANFARQYPVQVGTGSGAGTAVIFPATADRYLPDRSEFYVKATPSAGSQFIRWGGVTYLAASGSSVSVSPAFVEMFGTSSYQAIFSTAPVTVVDSKPQGALVTVDGTGYLTPVNLTLAAGTQHTIAYNSPQLFGTNTERLQFLQWDDGSTGSRTFTAGTSGATYTATFKRQFLLATSFLGQGTVTTAPVSTDGFYDEGTTVQVTATPAAGQTLRYWVGDAAGGGLQQNLVMDQERLVLANFGSKLPYLALNAASFALNPFPESTGQSVAPGQIATVFVPGIGPATPVQPSPDANGRFPTTVQGVTVFFDGIPAPITYGSANQINVIAPYGIAGQSLTTITIAANGTVTPAFSIGVLPTNPGLFTSNGSGKGPVAALNQDGTVNTAQNPAAAGSIVVLYGTGAGVLNRSIPDGQVTGADTATPAAGVYVRFGKLPAELLYAGTAPYLVNGALQVNARVPAEVIGGGEVPVQLIAGPYTSAPGTTIWVK